MERHMRATWYVLEDGTAVDPIECAPDETGALTLKSGAKVAMRSPDCPMSTGVDLADDYVPFGGKGDHDGDGKPGGAAPAKKTEDIKPAPAPKPAKRTGYKTRGR